MTDVLSDIITNRDAVPAVAQDGFQVGSFLKETIAVVTPAADEAITSNLILCAIPSSARVSSVELSHAEAATTGQGNVGIMRKVDGAYTFTGGDADFFASAYDFDDAGVATSVYVDVTRESGVYTHAKAVQQIWEALGLSEDPNEDFYVAIDVSEIFAGGPTSILSRVRFTS